MSRERCMAFMDDLGKCDYRILPKWFTDESVLWMPPSEPITGARRICSMFRVIFRMYSNIHWKVSEVHPIGGSRYIYLTDSWGIIGADTPYKNHIISIIEFDAQDRILYLSDYFKDTAIFKTGRDQLGAAAAAPSAEIPQ